MGRLLIAGASITMCYGFAAPLTQRTQRIDRNLAFPSETDAAVASRPVSSSELGALSLSRILSGDASARAPDTTLLTMAVSILLLAVPLIVSVTSKAISSGMAFTIVHSAVRAFLQLMVLGSLILSPLISLDMAETSSRAIVGSYMTLMALIGSYEGEVPFRSPSQGTESLRSVTLLWSIRSLSRFARLRKLSASTNSSAANDRLKCHPAATPPRSILLRCFTCLLCSIMFLSAFMCTIYLTTSQKDVNALLNPALLIPVLGMLVGNATSALSLALSTFFSGVKSEVSSSSAVELGLQQDLN